MQSPGGHVPQSAFQSLSALTTEQAWWVWNVLGRGPALVVLLLIALGARRVMSGRAVIVGLSGFAAGASLGTAMVPSILGAIGGGVSGVLATWRFVGARLPGPLLPVSLLVGLMAVGRWGCLLVGCCFGRPTAGDWGVAYGAGSLAHLLHHHEGFVASTAATSAPVIPVQPLESVAFMALLGATFLLRKRFRSEAQHALVLVAGVLIIRAALDPLRAMVNTWGSVLWHGALTRFQWVTLIGAALCLVLALRTPSRRGSTITPEAETPFRWSVAFGLQGLVVALTFSEGTLFLRALSVASLVLAGGLLTLQLMGRSRLLVVAAAVALVPLGLWADDGAPRPSGWSYATGVVPGHLIRLGPGALGEPGLLSNAVSLLNATGGGVEPRAFERWTLAALVVGGRTGQYSPGSCGGSVTPLAFGRVGAELVGSRLNGDTLTLRAQVHVEGDTQGVTAGPSISGLYEWRWKSVSLGAGLQVGVWGSTRQGPYPYQNPFVVIPASLTTGAAIGGIPLVYLRLEFLPPVALELGNAGPYQPLDGPFVALRFGADQHDAISVRLGLETTRFFIVNVSPFVSAGFRLSDQLRVQLRASVALDSQIRPSLGVLLSWGL